MHILQIISGRQCNGALAHCLALSKHLIERGHEVTVLCRRQSWIWDKLAEAGVNRQACSLKRRWSNIRDFGRLAKSWGVDVLHSHQTSAHNFAILLKLRTGIPAVASAHSRHVQLHWRFHDRVVAVSAATAAFHRTWNGLPKRRVCTIHNFVQQSKKLSGEEKVAIRRQLGIGDQEIVLAAVGDIIPRKGLTYLLSALALLVEADIPARLLVVGRNSDKAYTAACQQQARELRVQSRVSWLGLIPDVTNTLQACDLYVLPSLEESLPMAVLEAMEVGLPVVATNVGGIPECIDDAVNGCLVPPRDSRQLAEVLQQLACDAPAREQMAARARQKVMDAFSPSSQVDQFEQLYSQVARSSQALTIPAAA